MSKLCYNYDSKKYEDIDRDGYSWTQRKYVDNWDDSEYRCEEEEKRYRMLYDEDEGD